MTKGTNSAIKGQLVVDNQVTGETMRVPLGAPRARQWSSASSATKYIQSLAGIDNAELLQNIRVNDVPIDECHNLVSIRQQGGIINVTASVAPPVVTTMETDVEPVEMAVAPVEPEKAPHQQEELAAPMETEIDGLAVKLAPDTTQADFEKMTPLQRMLSVPESQWLY
tara:strand:+ start:285 stop:788 length:504 start_codon:yes stop_codon:yes gene_type:complete